MKKWIKKWLVRFIASFIASFIVLSLLMTLPLILINPPTWSWKIQRSFSPPQGYKSPAKHDWVNYADISSNMKLAVIAAEDQHFPNHYGVDFNAIYHAVKDKINGKSARGASTLTQQTVKNLYLWSGKNLVRKGIEAYLSVLVDATWSKERVLEVYLNIVEFGPGIYGVEAASQHFFGLSAKQLSSNQAAQLAAVLPNPYIYNVSKPSAYQQKRIRWIQKQMRQLSLNYLGKLD